MSKHKKAASAAKKAKNRLKLNKPVRTPNHPKQKFSHGSGERRW